jgi:hypothetical protein
VPPVSSVILAYIISIDQLLLPRVIIYGDGMLYRDEPGLKTMKIMKGDKTVMVGERTMTHLYKL